MDSFAEHTLECPHCGRVFSLELTRCPGCGLNMYPEDEDEATGSEGIHSDGVHLDEADEQTAGAGLWAVILGWILAGAASFIIQMFASQAVTGGSLPIGWKLALFLASPLGAAVGGQVILEASMLAQYALCIILGGGAAWLRGVASQDTGSLRTKDSAPAQGMSWEDLMYRDLLTRVRFNRDTAERLIEYERRLAPEADRYTLLRNAVERLERDRG
jgi:hypothetical protein